MRTHLKDFGVTLLLVILVSLNFYFLNGDLSWQLLLLIGSYLVWTQFFRLSAASLTFFSLMTLFLFHKSIPTEFIPILDEREAGSKPYFLLALGTLFLLAFLSEPVRKLPARWRQPLLHLWAFYILVPFLVRILPLSETDRHVAKILWLALGHCWWYFIFLISDKSHLPRSIFTRVGFLFPVVQFIALRSVIGPLVLGPKTFEETRSTEPLNVIRKKVPFFLFATLGFTGTVFLFKEVFSQVPLHYQFTLMYLNSEISFLKYLLYGTLSFFPFMAFSYGAFNMMAALYRVGGHSFPAATSIRVLKSRDFVDFFNRVLYFVKEVYAQLFFYPLFLSLGWIRGFRLRVVISTFTSLCLGSAFYFVSLIFKKDDPLFDKGIIHYITQYRPGIFVMFALMAIVISYSQWHRLTYGVPKERKPVPQMFAISGYLLFFVLTYFIEMWPRNLPLLEGLRVYFLKLSP